MQDLLLKVNLSNCPIARSKHLQIRRLLFWNVFTLFCSHTPNPQRWDVGMGAFFRAARKFVSS